ncbi:hypothetical protein K491DRAFT_721877 [Lophiostoma macrostomum CBS 122681]|uniref:F-box domain-containing protein n=1 Tax=Lophiostoma macrostomum CBS 122681 TaxID=1314788 RepID=A0A6A6SRK5_9PLEO|nr:hypothetical protein K491DRAFT_721877 [Lophiostoma macrostomum CBS 122681]
MESSSQRKKRNGKSKTNTSTLIKNTTITSISFPSRPKSGLERLLTERNTQWKNSLGYHRLFNAKPYHKENKFQSIRFLDLPTELRLMVYERLPVKATHIYLARGNGPNGLHAVMKSIVGLSVLRACRSIHSEATAIMDGKKEWIISQPPSFYIIVNEYESSSGFINRTPGGLDALVAYWMWYKTRPSQGISTWEEAREDLMLRKMFPDIVLDPKIYKVAQSFLHILRSRSLAFANHESPLGFIWKTKTFWTVEIALRTTPRATRLDSDDVYADLLGIAQSSRGQTSDIKFKDRPSQYRGYIRTYDGILWPGERPFPKVISLGHDVNKMEWDTYWAEGERLWDR